MEWFNGIALKNFKFEKKLFETIERLQWIIQFFHDRVEVGWTQWKNFPSFKKCDCCLSTGCSKLTHYRILKMPSSKWYRFEVGHKWSHWPEVFEIEPKFKNWAPGIKFSLPKYCAFNRFEWIEVGIIVVLSWCLGDLRRLQINWCLEMQARQDSETLLGPCDKMHPIMETMCPPANGKLLRKFSPNVFSHCEIYSFPLLTEVYWLATAQLLI